MLSVGTTYAPDSVRDLAGAALVCLGTAHRESDHERAGRHRAEPGAILVGDHRFLRVDCLTRPGDYGRDGSDQVDALARLGRSKAVERMVIEPVKERFLNSVAAPPFQLV